MLDIVGKRYWYFVFSLLVIVPGVISLSIPPALKPGIEFTSGSTTTLRFERSVGEEDLRQAYRDLGHGDAIIQHTGEGEYLVRTRTLAIGVAAGAGEKEEIEAALQERFGPLTVLDFATVSPIVAAEIVRNAALAVAAASVGILLYITWAFRAVSHPVRYGTCAIIAMVHDILVVAGLFSIFGKLFGIEINAMFITALLTVIGFSVHDTIVVFDRIRENLKRSPGREFYVVVNESLLQTLGRSLNTSLTVVLTLVALLLFGGVTIRDFVLVLLIGIISGTYSSVFNGSQLLVVWQYGELGSLFRRLRTTLRPA